MRKFSTHSVSATSLFKNFSHHAFVHPGFIQHDRPNRLCVLFSHNLSLFILDADDAKIWWLREICVAKVYKAFEGHKVGKVILISSKKSETSPSCRFVDQKYMIAINGLKSKPVTWIFRFGTRIEFSFRNFSFENHAQNKNSRSLFSLIFFS